MEFDGWRGRRPGKTRNARDGCDECVADVADGYPVVTVGCGHLRGFGDSHEHAAEDLPQCGGVRAGAAAGCAGRGADRGGVGGSAVGNVRAGVFFPGGGEKHVRYGIVFAAQYGDGAEME